MEPRRGPERLLDLLLRAGPYDLTLADLEAAPHGIDLGPLEPRLPHVLRTPSGMIELAPPQIVADCAVALEAKGVELISPLTDHPFGHRTIFFRDPDGNVLEIFAEI